MAAGIDEFFGDDAGRKDFAAVVNIFEKKIQRGDALGESGLNLTPLGVWNDAWEKVVREDALRAFGVAINREGNALMQERKFGGLLALAKFLGRKV